MDDSKVVAIVSGGLDSTTLVYALRQTGHDVLMLSFDYGQRHRRELLSAQAVARDLGLWHKIVNLSGIRGVLGGSALTDEIDVPEGHYAADNMKVTVVPNRNAIFLSVAYGVAVAQAASGVAFAAHAGDHFIYPDCRPAFIDAFEQMEALATEGFGSICLKAPFVTKTKADIVRLGAELGVPFDLTWSCYKGGNIHCGRCGTCVERVQAFAEAGVSDPTAYADNQYAMSAV